MQSTLIGSHQIGVGLPSLIIAEAGVNHNGDFSRAKKMIDAAKRVGADAIKFQTFKTENLVTVTADKAAYQGDNSETQFQMLKKLELSDKSFKELSDYSKKRDIIFLSTPFDFQSANLLQKIGVIAYKIGSGDITDTPLLRHVARWGKPMILSTGMSTIEEIEESIKTVQHAGCKDVVLLHCTSNYPTEAKDANINMIPALRERFHLNVGFSDHTMSTTIPASAVALGAVVVEKHFTLDHNLEGPDHKMSLEPKDFKEMVKNIRETELALGDGAKKITDGEKHIKSIARKSIVAAQNIPKGVLITREMLTIKRPGTGLEPKNLEHVVGMRARHDITKDSLIQWEDIEQGSI